jgi:uncharacterized protein (TIGR03437 family)
MLASVFSYATSRFGDQTADFHSVPNPIPLPTSLGDVQVTVAGIKAPLLYASPGQINFQVPSATPVGDVQEIQVIRASTGQVLASSLFQIQAVAPGLFTVNSTGDGQLAASNQDFTTNDASHPAKPGSIITLYGTGQGVVAGMPPDGQLTPNAPPVFPTSFKPQVFINGPDYIPDADVQFSGLAPGFVGLWQINAKIPANAPPGDVQVYVSFQNLYNSTTDAHGIHRKTTIRVSP